MPMTVDCRMIDENGFVKQLTEPMSCDKNRQMQQCVGKCVSHQAPHYPYVVNEVFCIITIATGRLDTISLAIYCLNAQLSLHCKA